MTEREIVSRAHAEGLHRLIEPFVISGRTVRDILLIAAREAPTPEAAYELWVLAEQAEDLELETIGLTLRSKRSG